MDMPNIFKYNNFRAYLADYQKARHACDRSFTRSRFSKMLGMPNTRSYFTNVLHGKKVSSVFVDRFIRAMKLDKEQAQFFRVLIQFNQAENADERELCFNQLISLNRTPKKILSADQYDYYSNWYNSTIRALLHVYEFIDDYAGLAKKVFPAITAGQAKRSIRLLLKLNLIVKNDRGFLKPTEKSISSNAEIRAELIKNFQIACLELEKNIIVYNKTMPQTVSTNVISISAEGYRRLEAKLAQFRNEVRSIIHKDENKADRVYQLNIALFPNSKWVE